MIFFTRNFDSLVILHRQCITSHWKFYNVRIDNLVRALRGKLMFEKCFKEGQEHLFRDYGSLEYIGNTVNSSPKNVSFLV